MLTFQWEGLATQGFVRRILDKYSPFANSTILPSPPASPLDAQSYRPGSDLEPPSLDPPPLFSFPPSAADAPAGEPRLRARCPTPDGGGDLRHQCGRPHRGGQALIRARGGEIPGTLLPSISRISALRFEKVNWPSKQ